MLTLRRQRTLTWLSITLILSVALTANACGGNEPRPTPAPETSAVPDQGTDTVAERLDAASTFYATGDYDGAISELEAAIGLEPDNVDAYTNLALSHFQNGDYESAVAAWTAAIDLRPDEAALYYERGTSYFNLKQYEEAIADFTESLDLDSDNADAYRIRGKAYAFLDDYDQAVADFTQTIDLAPSSDEAYFNRAVATTKGGGTMEDLPGIIADYGMVLQISEDSGMREQAERALETLLENTDDPDVRQQATDALQGKVSTIHIPSVVVEPSLMDTDVTRAPGHSIGFEAGLEPGGVHRFLFLASPGDTVGASISSSSEMAIGIQNTSTGNILGAVPSNDDSLFVTIPQNALYHIIVEDTGGQGGDYVASFEASEKVSFALDPNYFMIGRLPEGGLLYYTFSAPGGSTLQGNVIPHPDTPIDAVVTIRDLESQAVLSEANASGPGENEQFAYTLPDSEDGRLLTVIVAIEDADRGKGAYILAVSSDAASPAAPTVDTPESVVTAVFDAARSGDFAPLGEICDPLGEHDGDTQMICDLATDGANRDAFVAAFSSGKVNGTITISADGTKATVPFLFGPDGDDEETMQLINRNGRWYLLEF